MLLLGHAVPLLVVVRVGWGGQFIHWTARLGRRPVREPRPTPWWVRVLGGGEVFEHFSSHVAFQDPDDLADRFPSLVRRSTYRLVSGSEARRLMTTW